MTKQPEDALSATTSGRVNRKSRYRLSMTSRPPYTDSTAASAVAAVTPGPASREPITNTISGSARGWMSRSRGTGAPAGSTIASVSQATSGELMFIRCCLARLVSPSLTPTSRSPRASRRRSVSSCTAYAVARSRPGHSSVIGGRSVPAASASSSTPAARSTVHSLIARLPPGS